MNDDGDRPIEHKHVWVPIEIFNYQVPVDDSDPKYKYSIVKMEQKMVLACLCGAFRNIPAIPIPE